VGVGVEVLGRVAARRVGLRGWAVSIKPFKGWVFNTPRPAGHRRLLEGMVVRVKGVKCQDGSPFIFNCRSVVTRSAR
jgi:hypothetical protein